MKELGIIVGAAIIAGAAMMIMPILYVAGGAIGGWVVGWAFNDTYAAISTKLGWEFASWQTGAFLAFVGGYFRSINSNTSKK